jgi:succinoglycan biosynthesis protein ExoA
MSGPVLLSVSVIIPVRDEIARVAAVLSGLQAQSRQPDQVVVADGRSQGGTREWLEHAAVTRPWLHIVDNPQRIVPTGLNAALRAATGDIVARMDAHADYAPDYLERVLVSRKRVVLILCDISAILCS